MLAALVPITPQQQDTVGATYIAVAIRTSLAGMYAAWFMGSGWMFRLYWLHRCSS